MEKDILERFGLIATRKQEWLTQWRANSGKKIIGCFPMYVPEELIHAAGFLPITLLSSNEPITAAGTYLPSYLCHCVRSNFDLNLNHKLEYLDGLVFPDICDPIKHLSSIWELSHSTPFFYHLMFPKRLDTPLALKYLIEEIGRFKKALEGFSGNEIPAAKIKQSIVIYNETRRLLKQVYNLRKEKPDLFSASEMVTLVVAAMLMPKEEYNPLLAQYLTEKKTRLSQVKNKVKLIIWGNPCESLDQGIIDILDKQDIVIVGDDLFTGMRYYATPVDENGDPVEALAKAHMQLPPCPTRYNPDKSWSDSLIAETHSSNAQGVLLVSPKFCDVHMFEHPFIKQELDKANIPYLLIETDQSGTSGKMVTQIQAFKESISEAIS